MDDAALADPGQCQIESWIDRYHQNSRSAHLGAACRIGDWELGANLDASRAAAEPTTRVASLQAKHVIGLTEQLAIGVVAGPSFERDQLSGVGVLLPLTWQASGSLQLHMNIGRQWMRHLPSRPLAGAAIEWAATPSLSFIAERFNDATGRVLRTGTRWQAHKTVALDLSRARAASDLRGTWWTVGATWTIDRVVR